MGITSSASIEEFACEFKDTTDYNDITEVENISLYGSESKEDQQPIVPPKRTNTCANNTANITPALLYSYLTESMKKQLPRPPLCYLLLGGKLASLDQLSLPISSLLMSKGVFSTSI